MTEEGKSSRGVALVTGASGGIGRELCRLFAENGFDLVLVSRGEKKLKETARELGSRWKVNATVLAKDLSRPEAADEVFDAVQRQGVTVNVLVNNAGFGDHAPFPESDWQTQRQMMQVNIGSLVRLTHLFLPGMVGRGSGKILNIGSTASFGPVPYMAVYGASKAFVLSLSEALAMELEGTGVTVTALCPGTTETNFAKRAGTGKTRMLRFRQMDPAAVARAGYRGLMRGKRQVIPGFMNRLMIRAMRFVPHAVVLRFSKLMMER